MKKSFLLVVSLFIVASTSVAAPPQITDEATAKTYSEAIYKLFCAGDYKAYADQLPEGLLKYVTQENYQKSSELLAQKLGKLKGLTYLSTLRQPGLNILVWKCEYESKTGKNFDCLVTTAFKVKDGSWTLAGFRFL